MRSKKAIVKVAFFCSILMLCIFAAVYRYRTSPNTIIQKNLEAVLETAFTGPDEKLSLYYDVCYNDKPLTEEIQTAEDRLKELHSLYVTGRGLKYFIDYYCFIHMVDQMCVNTLWTTWVDQIEVIPYHDSKDYYDYVLTMKYSKPGQAEEEIVISGRAGRDEAGKIEYWKLSSRRREMYKP